MEADEPWQTLACCMEIARAVRAPDPTAYVSHFPVHQVSWGHPVWSGTVFHSALAGSHKGQFTQARPLPLRSPLWGLLPTYVCQKLGASPVSRAGEMQTFPQPCPGPLTLHPWPGWLL